MGDQKKYTNKLAGKRVLVVGGSSGIGYGVAEASLELGASVIISSSQQSRVEAAIASLRAAYPSAKDRVSGYGVDLGTESTLEQNVKDLLQKVGTVDHIVHTAGDTMTQKPLEDVTFKDLKQGGMVRFFAPFLLVKAAYANKHISPGPTSSITLTTGIISERPFKGYSVSSGYSGGKQSMTRSLALEMAPIRVNVVSPGAVATPLFDSLAPERREALYTHFNNTLLTGKIGQVEHITHAYLYAMQDENTTGTVINSNGGGMLV